MSRTIACFLTALFTFFTGVGIYWHQFSVELLSDEAINRPAVRVTALDHRELQVPLRLGIFVGVDGVTFSTDNTKFNFFDDL